MRPHGSDRDTSIGEQHGLALPSWCDSMESLRMGPTARAASLSGGNQQKLIVARELSRNPAVLVAENPTRGLDIGAAAAIRSRIRAAAEARSSRIGVLQ